MTCRRQALMGAAIVGTLLFVCSAFAGSDASVTAEDLLNKMRTAMANLSYRGIVAYSKDRSVENMEILHQFSGGIEREKLISLNGPMREVVRQGQEVKCYFPDSATVFIGSKPSGKSAFVDLPEDFLKLRPYYDFSLGRRDRIAQREAQEIVIAPRDSFRYGRRIWVDLASNLALRVELLDETDSVVEQMVFSSLEVGSPISSDELDLSPAQHQLQWKTSANTPLAIDTLRWQLQNVPSGFQIVSFSRVKHGAEAREIDHLLLSDGLSSVSIYFDRVGDKLMVPQPRSVGAIHAFMRQIGEYSVTTMGEVPDKAVEYVGNGIRLQN